jgi:hypothetical protein
MKAVSGGEQKTRILRKELAMNALGVLHPNRYLLPYCCGFGENNCLCNNGAI